MEDKQNLIPTDILIAHPKLLLTSFYLGLTMPNSLYVFIGYRYEDTLGPFIQNSILKEKNWMYKKSHRAFIGTEEILKY